MKHQVGQGQAGVVVENRGQAEQLKLAKLKLRIRGLEILKSKFTQIASRYLRETFTLLKTRPILHRLERIYDRQLKSVAINQWKEYKPPTPSIFGELLVRLLLTQNKKRAFYTWRSNIIPEHRVSAASRNHKLVGLLIRRGLGFDRSALGKAFRKWQKLSRREIRQLVNVISRIRYRQVYSAFSLVRTAQKEVKKHPKRQVKGKDLYFRQTLTNLVECLSENLRETKYKAFSQLKSSAIMLTHQHSTFVKLLHKFEHKSRYLYFKRWHRQSLAIESAKAIKLIRDEHKARLVKKLLNLYCRVHLRYGLGKWLKKAKAVKEYAQRNRAVGCIKVVQQLTVKGLARQAMDKWKTATAIEQESTQRTKQSNDNNEQQSKLKGMILAKQLKLVSLTIKREAFKLLRAYSEASSLDEKPPLDSVSQILHQRLKEMSAADNFTSRANDARLDDSGALTDRKQSSTSTKMHHAKSPQINIKIDRTPGSGMKSVTSVSEVKVSRDRAVPSNQPIYYAMSQPFNAVANNRYQNSEKTQLVNVHPSLIKSSPKLTVPIGVNLSDNIKPVSVVKGRNVSPRYVPMESTLIDFQQYASTIKHISDKKSPQQSLSSTQRLKPSQLQVGSKTQRNLPGGAAAEQLRKITASYVSQSSVSSLSAAHLKNSDPQQQPYLPRSQTMIGFAKSKEKHIQSVEKINQKMHRVGATQIFDKLHDHTVNRCLREAFTAMRAHLAWQRRMDGAYIIADVTRRRILIKVLINWVKNVYHNEIANEAAREEKREQKLIRAIYLAQRSHQKEEVMMLRYFREWKRQGYEMVLEGLKHYSQTLAKDKRNNQQRYKNLQEVFASQSSSSTIQKAKQIAQRPSNSSRSPVPASRRTPVVATSLQSSSQYNSIKPVVNQGSTGGVGYTSNTGAISYSSLFPQKKKGYFS